MNDNLNQKTILHSRHINKRKRTKKPWWTDSLSELWNTMCSMERDWLGGADVVGKRIRKKGYISKEKRIRP